MRCMRRIADCWGEILVGAPAWSRGGLVGPFAAGPPLPRGWCASVGLGEILVGAVAWARWGFGWTLRGGAAAPTGLSAPAGHSRLRCHSREGGNP